MILQWYMLLELSDRPKNGRWTCFRCVRAHLEGGVLGLALLRKRITITCACNDENKEREI